jgi:hypothetical protein
MRNELHRLSATLVLSQYLLYHLGTMIKCMLGNTDETNDYRVAYTALQHSACTRRTAWSCATSRSYSTRTVGRSRLQAASILTSSTESSVGQVRYGWLFSDQIRCLVTSPRECIAGEL